MCLDQSTKLCKFVYHEELYISYKNSYAVSYERNMLLIDYFSYISYINCLFCRMMNDVRILEVGIVEHLD